MNNIYNFKAAYNKDKECVELSWETDIENAEGDVSYLIYKDWEQYAVPTEFTFTDSAISPNTLYAYQVAMLVNGEEVAWSEEIEVTIPKNYNLLIYTSKGYYNEIAKRIKKKLGYKDKITPSQMPYKIKEVYLKGQDKGKQAERKAFWDIFQNYGNRRKYSYAWYEYPGTTVNPEYEIIVYCGGNNFFYRAFYNSNVKEILKPIRISGPSACPQVFNQATELETIILLDITGYTNEYTSWFDLCTSLVHIRWNGEIAQTLNMGDCPLVKESIKDTINHLSGSASGKTLTLKKSAVDKAFETSLGANDGSISVEWIELITPVSNSYDGKWTISLS